ncbi:HutD/Ves family protein [Microvirga pudoricolor]|uniref:HutD/Ves family protein n=1 Tax=Microvirga pudoricolor TaxID=2778729 RepID=UPI001951DD08|nr:HutD family protein [Microvirga pudoricolor]MBM6593692.1 HutD family protein [Microvirga pudoricolor]
MTARVIRAADLVRVPWKNGGGTTAEVLAYPEGSGFDSFGWRLSMADVAADGPFSAFPGIDRTLILAEGDGIELSVEGVPTRLDRIGAKLSFDGADATAGTLLAGPIRDLNVMTRRGLFSHRVRRVEAGVVLLAEGTRTAFVIPLQGTLDVTLGAQLHALGRLDTLALDGTSDIIQVSGTGNAVLVEIAPEV